MIHKDILDRYEFMLREHEPLCQPIPGTDESHLRWMLEEIRTHQKQDENKYHRWFGFIQGILIMKGYTTVEDERNFTRLYFKK